MDDLDRVTRFFYKCLTVRKPRADGSEWKLFWWATKYWSAQLYFLLYRKYIDFWSVATKYYPFSRFYQDRKFHYRNKPAANLMRKIESTLRIASFKIDIHSGRYDEPLTEFYGTFENESDLNEDNFLKIEEILQLKYGDMYVRPHERGFKVLISTDILSTKYLMK